MLAEQSHPSDFTKLNILQQMQLFDLNQPKDVTTIIEVCQDDLEQITTDNPNTSAYSKSDFENALNITPRRMKAISEKGIKRKAHDKQQEVKTTRRRAPNRKQLKSFQQQVYAGVPFQVESNNLNYPTLDIPHTLELLQSRHVGHQNLRNGSIFNDNQTRTEQEKSIQNTLDEMYSRHCRFQQPNTSMPIWDAPHTLQSVQNDTLIVPVSHAQQSLYYIIHNMIHILNIKKTNQIQNRQYYLFQKNKILKTCYRHIEKYLLPQKNNLQIMNKFICLIASIAKDKLIPTQYNQIQELLFDILECCENVRNVVLSRIPKLTPPNPSLMSLQIPKLNQNNSKNTSKYYNNSSNKEPVTKCLLSVGLPGKEVKITIDSKLYLEIVGKKQRFNKAPTKLYEEKQNIHERETPKLSEMSVDHGLDFTTTSQSFFESAIPKINENEIRSRSIGKVNNINNSFHIVPNSINDHQNIIQNHNIRNTNKEIEIPGIDYNSIPNCKINSNFYRNEPSNIFMGNNTWQEQVENYNQNIILENREQVTRSSISRDSGNMSPLKNNAFEDLMNPVSLKNKDGEVMPNITHVTSLNKNTSYIISSRCQFCQRETKTKCKGCYKIYYCTRECQKAEWNHHKYFCS